ncbi:MAG: hypothetical protein ACLFPO_00970 [Spirochaetaceae bacterium]
MSHNRSAAAAPVSLLASFLLLLSSCGIESTVFIAGPRPDEVDLVPATDTERITFLHNEDDNDSDEFRGYDLYYKLYEAEDGQWGCEPGDPCRNDRDYILNDPVQTGPSRLRGRDYRRLIQGNSPGQTPNIPVSSGIKGNEFDVEIDISGGGAGGTPEDAFTATWPDDTVTLNRDVSQGGTHKRFLDDNAYEDTDDDISHIESDIAEVIADNNLYVAVYSLGYGVDPGSLQVLYSEPVYLGYVRVDFN